MMDVGTIGRDAEIAEISGFLLAASGAPAAMAITGDAGIGKTMVWRYVLRAASGLSRVLSCQPASAERPLPFSALDDLFGGVAQEILPALAGPSRRAMETVLLRDQSAEAPSLAAVKNGRPPLEWRALARGVLDALRILSGGSPLVLAIDDAQWLDRPSAKVLDFCIRRLDGEHVSILLTFRTEDPVPLGLDRALSPDRLARVHLGPLSLGAIGEILRSRLGEALPRYALTRLYDASGGNPFYALEYARLLLGHPHISRTNEPIPIPRSLRDLVSRRLSRLGPDARRVGRLVAASPDPRERVIRAACDDRESWTAIDQAIDAGILERDGDGLRFTHPLLRSAMYAEMTLSQRREIHLRLAAAVQGIEEHAWHLALGADRPSEDIAETLDSAARHAASRGAPEAAAVLVEQGMRLTPVGRAAALRDRTVRAADYYFRGGDTARSRELIESVLTACPVGPDRAPLLARLATIDYHQSGWPVAEQTFRRAVEQAPDDPALCAHAEQELAFARMVAGDLPAASRWAATSLRSAERAAAPRLIAHSLARIALFEFLQGNGVQVDLLDRAEALEASAPEEPVGRLPMLDPALVTGMVLKWCDRLDQARLRLAARYRLALDRGDEASLPFLLYHFSQLECWAGKWDAAEEYALEACRVADETHQQAMRPATLYSLALVRAHRGQVRDARELADEALGLCDRTGNVPVSTVVIALLGFVALSLDDHKAAHAQLGPLAEAIASVGLGEPSVVKFLPDEIEALAALGHVELAESLTRRLQARGTSLGRPWALATAARCRAHLAAIDGDFQEAWMAIEQALSAHSQLPMPFELGRTLLVKGMIERRAKCKSAARESLGQALSIFEGLGAPLWAGKADREISRIAVRSPADRLTETEGRIAALIARGHTNREVASAMFVTENTVQTHVRHIFQKLGIRSRTELAARLLPASPSPGNAQGLPPDRARLELVRPTVPLPAKLAAHRTGIPWSRGRWPTRPARPRLPPAPCRRPFPGVRPRA
jgi:DNA-binding CsgD family transcriptional regulator/tetratricopeptide (TPR) repeat protein